MAAAAVDYIEVFLLLLVYCLLMLLLRVLFWFGTCFLVELYEPRHVISNNVVF